MYAVRRYNDLLIEIQLCKLRISDLETQIENIDKLMIKPPSEVKAMSYSGMPKGSTDYTSLDRYLMRRNENIKLLDYEVELLEQLLKQKKEQENKVKQFEGIEYKIAYLKIIKGYSYKQIAEKLDKSEQYIKNIYSKLNKLK